MKIITTITAVFLAGSMSLAHADAPKTRASAIAAVRSGGATASANPRSPQNAGRPSGNFGRGGRDYNRYGGGRYSGNYYGGHHHRHGGFGYDSTIILGDFGYPYYPTYGYGYGGYGYGGFGYGGYAYPGYAGYYRDEVAPVYEGELAGRRGDTSLVAQLQRRLARGGYYHGTIDGMAGTQTRRAIRHYERDHGLPADGEIDERLLAKMGLV